MESNSPVTSLKGLGSFQGVHVLGAGEAPGFASSPCPGCWAVAGLALRSSSPPPQSFHPAPHPSSSLSGGQGASPLACGAPFAAGLSPGWPVSAYAWPGQTHLANETTLINSGRVKVASRPKPSLPLQTHASQSFSVQVGGCPALPTRDVPELPRLLSPTRVSPLPGCRPQERGAGVVRRARYRQNKPSREHLCRAPRHQPRFSLFLIPACFLICPTSSRGKLLRG